MYRKAIILLTLAIGLSVLSSAATLSTVSLDTTPLIGHPAAPFSINFQLNDGSGTGDSNNTAAIDAFDFGGGSATPGTTLVGGASGDLLSGIKITDSGFLNLFTQGFVPGAQLRFSLLLSANGDTGGTPDQFSFAILDSSGFELPYLSVFNAALVINIQDASHDIEFAGTDPSASPFGGGDPILMDPPEVSSSVPEPASGLLIVLGSISILLSHRRSLRP